jgi:flavodoxin
MNALVIFESMYGNTHAVADAIADGLRTHADVEVLSIHDAGSVPGDADLLVVGGPTHMHGLTTAMSRRLAISAASEDEDIKLERGAGERPGLRSWLRDLDARGIRAAAFDTRGDARAALTGSAAKGIARRLRRRGCDIVGMESFLVADMEGPLEEGELSRAREWGKSLASVPAPTARAGAR